MKPDASLSRNKTPLPFLLDTHDRDMQHGNVSTEFEKLQELRKVHESTLACVPLRFDCLRFFATAMSGHRLYSPAPQKRKTDSTGHTASG